MKWGLLWSGLCAVAIVAIMGMVIAGSDGPTSHSFNSAWLFVIFPLLATGAGALVIAGRDSGA
jgi:energy-converting hydrogenase Eha subunit A